MEDIPLMHRWLNMPHVKQWYNHESDTSSLESIVEMYADPIRGEDPAHPFVILYAGVPVGHIQSYRIRDFPEYCRATGLGDEAQRSAGLDVFIGELAYVHRGLGPKVLREFMRQVVFVEPDINACVIGPQPDNRAAIRAYEKAGFKYLKTIQPPGESTEEYLMIIGRKEA